jgi:hypothetical protein
MTNHAKNQWIPKQAQKHDQVDQTVTEYKENKN